MRTKDFILLGAGYAAGRLSKKMQAGPIGAVWSKEQEKAVKRLDKKFNDLLNKKGIEPYSYEAGMAWRDYGFRDKMKRIFKKK